MRYPVCLLFLLGLFSLPLSAQDRETKVRNDRRLLENSDHWIYNDLPRGLRQARLQRRPLLVVLRCIPCEACHDFDEQVVEREPRIRALMDEFVCVRIPQSNGLDLSLFQIDFDMSFGVIYLHHDGTLLGRFGTRTGRDNEAEDMQLEGFAESMSRVLDLSRDFPKHKAALADKRPGKPRFASPEQYPSLKGKYTDRLDYQGKVVQSCIHCHQVGEAERLVYRNSRRPVPDEVMFPWPGLDVLGIKCDPKTATTISNVAAGSIAARAGLQPGDNLLSMNGQPLVSVADAQWVLQQTGDSGTIAVTAARTGKTLAVDLNLPAGWRRTSDISWRATSWDLRRMALGGLLLEPVPENERARWNIPRNQLILRVKHVGQYGDHARAKNAGVQSGDLLIGYDRRQDFQTETDLLAYALQQKRPGDNVELEVLRNGERKTLRITLQ